MACIRKRRDRWVIDFYDQHGKRRWKTMKEGTNKKQARAELRGIEEKVEKGEYISPAKIPSFSKVADMWLVSKKPNIRHATYTEYKSHVECHLKPYYGQTLISRINFDSVEKFIEHCTSKEIATLTAKKIIISFGAIMSYAIKKRYINHNPVREVEKPKGQGNHKEDKEMVVLTPEQIRALINNTGWYQSKNRKTGKKEWCEYDKLITMKYKTLFMSGALTGMRQGEILGLKWDDINWKTKQVNVKRTFNNGHFYDPKTMASKRKIDIAPQLIAQLKKWQLACSPNNLNLVFPNGAGKTMDHNNLIKRHFLPTLKKASLPKIRFHDLRHCFASLLIDQNENPKYIQTQLGHSSITMTYDIYGHLMKTENPESAARLGNTVLGEDWETGSKMVADNTKRG